MSVIGRDFVTIEPAAERERYRIGQRVFCIAKAPPVGLEYGDEYIINDMHRKKFWGTDHAYEVLYLQFEGDSRRHDNKLFADKMPLNVEPVRLPNELFEL